MRGFLWLRFALLLLVNFELDLAKSIGLNLEDDFFVSWSFGGVGIGLCAGFLGDTAGLVTENQNH